MLELINNVARLLFYFILFFGSMVGGGGYESQVFYLENIKKCQLMEL
jgi:hypothetical protein